MRQIKHTPQSREFLDSLKQDGKRNHGVAIIHRYTLFASLPKDQILAFPTVEKKRDQPLVITFKIDYRELDDLSYWESYHVVCLVEKKRFVVVSIPHGKVQ